MKFSFVVIWGKTNNVSESNPHTCLEEFLSEEAVMAIKSSPQTDPCADKIQSKFRIILYLHKLQAHTSAKYGQLLVQMHTNVAEPLNSPS